MAQGYAPEVETFNEKWDKIAAVTRQEGIPAPVAQAVYQRDLQRLQTPGSYTQNGDQLLDEIRSAAQGKPVVQAPPQNPSDVLGNVGSDVKSFGSGLMGLFNKGIGDVAGVFSGHPQALENQVSALWRDPRVLRNPLHALLNSGSDPGGLAGELHTLAQSPVLSSIVPGVAVAGAFTKAGPGGQVGFTGSGLDTVAEHPFTSLLDVAPLLHGAGRLSSLLAKSGLSDADRAAIEEAARYKPTDVSPAAQAARAAAKDASLSFMRYQMATNPKGLLTLINRSILDLPFGDDTLGTYTANKLNAATKGQLGPIAASVSRIFAAPGHQYGAAVKGLLQQSVDFYKRHGMTDDLGRIEPELVQKFNDFLTHQGLSDYLDEHFTPDELAEFKSALPEYDEIAQNLLDTGLARDGLALVTDPRDGRIEPRATSGTDLGVVNRHRQYLETQGDALDAMHLVSQELGHRIDPLNAERDISGWVDQMTSGLWQYTDERYKEDANLKAAFPVGPAIEREAQRVDIASKGQEAAASTAEEYAARTGGLTQPAQAIDGLMGRLEDAATATLSSSEVSPKVADALRDRLPAGEKWNRARAGRTGLGKHLGLSSERELNLNHVRALTRLADKVTALKAAMGTGDMKLAAKAAGELEAAAGVKILRAGWSERGMPISDQIVDNARVLERRAKIMSANEAAKAKAGAQVSAEAERYARAREAALPVPTDIKRLFGRSGAFEKFHAALARGDLKRAGTLSRIIKNVLNQRYVERNPGLVAMRSTVEQVQRALGLWNTLKVRGPIEAHALAYQKLVSAIDRHPVASMLPRYVELFQAAMFRHLDGMEVKPDDFDMIYQQVADKQWGRGESLDKVVGRSEMARIAESARQELLSERSQGFRPVWVAGISEGDVRNLQRGIFDIEHISEPSSYKSRVPLSLGAVPDPMLGLSIRQAEHLEEQFMTEFFYGQHGIKARFGTTWDDVIKLGQQFVKEPPKGSIFDLGAARDKWARQHYIEVTPESFIGTRAAKIQTAAPAQGFVIPKEIHDSIQATLKSRRGTDKPYARVYQKGTNLFRYSLLNFSPRYQVHIYGAGTVLLLIRSDPISMLRQLSPAVAMMARDNPDLVRVMNELHRNVLWRPVFNMLRSYGERNLAKRGIQGGLPVELSHTFAEGTPDEMVQMYSYAKGHKLGELIKYSFGKADIPVDAGMKMANFGANALRATAYLIGERKGGEEMGLQFARKVFADMEAMTPLERSIIRYVMPFYGWTRHILQYVATLPLDNPYRAMVISQVINQEWADWNTGLPQSLVYLFELGATNASGAATALDLRQLDPLRSAPDVFTMAGFLSSLNPAIQTAITGLGISTQTGEPSNLYPSLTIDKFYDTLTNKPQNLSSILGTGLAQYVPESGVLDHFFQMSNYTRWAASNNQNAYMNQLYGALNFPWVPQQVNVYGELAKTESARWDVAKQAATDALNDPNPNGNTWQALMQYAYVPYSGYLVQPSALRKWAFDQVVQAGAWNGTQATLPPSNLIQQPYSAPY